MPVTREQSLDTLKTLGVAPMFVQSYNDKRLPRDLDIFFGPPEEFFIEPDTQQLYTHERLIPLLDDGNFALVLFYDPEKKVFIRKYLEHPEEEIHYSNWQQYLADLMIEIAENSDAEDSELAEIADILEFKKLGEVLAFLDSAHEISWEQYHANKAEFIATF